ncbi:hypothetical protein B0H10DRAFT_1950666 [Mycena sp. CBHHK59/15]|nr:hypothetical protein B0H10DRAFT_1950666 [Mycena sp. CBHHK59/15]
MYDLWLGTQFLQCAGYGMMPGENGGEQNRKTGRGMRTGNSEEIRVAMEKGHSRLNAIVNNNWRSSRRGMQPRIREKKRIRFICRAQLCRGNHKEIVCSMEGCVPSPDAGVALLAVASPVAYGFLDFRIRMFDFRNGLAQPQGTRRSKSWICKTKQSAGLIACRSAGEEGMQAKNAKRETRECGTMQRGEGLRRVEFTMQQKLGVRIPGPTEDQICYISTGGEVIVGAKHGFQRGVSVCDVHQTLFGHPDNSTTVSSRARWIWSPARFWEEDQMLRYFVAPSHQDRAMKNSGFSGQRPARSVRGASDVKQQNLTHGEAQGAAEWIARCDSVGEQNPFQKWESYQRPKPGLEARKCKP